MDSYGQIGREKPDYIADLDVLAQALDIGPVRVQLAERATAYRLVLCLAHRAQWMGKEPTTELGARPEQWLFVAKEREGCGWIQLGWVAASYVAEVLTLAHAGDAEVLAAFFNDLSEAVAGHRLTSA